MVVQSFISITENDFALCCWHCSSAVKANSCQKDWNGVIMVVDGTGIPLSASGHHDDSSLCSTLRWWEQRDDGRWDSDVLVTGQTGRRWWQTLFSLVPLSGSLPAPPKPPPLPPCSRVSPETNADYLFPWIPGGCCKDCRKASSLTPLCLETMVLRPTPPSSSLSLHTTQLSRVSSQMLTEAFTYTQNTLCIHLFGLLRLTVV